MNTITTIRFIITIALAAVCAFQQVLLQQEHHRVQRAIQQTNRCLDAWGQSLKRGG